MKKDNQLLIEGVQKQLHQIVNGEELKRSPVLAKFLEFVVKATLSGKQEEIKEYTIGVKALGRPADFNPQLDAIVRIHATRLRRVLTEYYLGAGKDDRIVIKIPKGTYVPVFYEKNEQPDTHGSPLRTQNKEGVNGATTAPRQPTSAKPVLAVLPFRGPGEGNTNEVLLETLGEQLSSQLARFENLSVLSFYLTAKLDPAGLKKLGGIDYIITGTMQMVTDTLKLSVQLITLDNGNILWADAFVRHNITGKNAFDIVDQIVGQIASVVADDHGIVSSLSKQKAWQHPQQHDVFGDAIDKYFNYTYDYDSGKFEEVLLAVENAWHLAEDNVLLTSVLAKLYLDQYACAVQHDGSLLEKGRKLAGKAVQLDLRSQLAQKALAWSLILSGHKQESVEVIDRCIAINPLASANLGTMGLGLIMMGEYEKGYAVLLQSSELNPHQSVCTRLGYPIYYYQKKAYGESSKWLESLAPFDIPFCSFLKTAIEVNMARENDKPITQPDNLKGHEANIIERIVLDPVLKKEILQAYERAGNSFNKVGRTKTC